ncbi:MAG: glycoside hydrolase family 5 protein [Proteobacteria bacterium]|nr:glycoside hydrolase family 5 protein [Pseudomonadota bacterium]
MKRSRLFGRAVLAIVACLSTSAASLGSGSAEWMTGVNLSGAELNPKKNRINFDYVYPTMSEIDYFRHKGFRYFRIPVLMDRLLRPDEAHSHLQPTDDWKALLALIRGAARVDAVIIIDFHQFGRTQSGLIGRDHAATKELASSWSEIAKRLKDQPNVIFNLMNEPHEQSASEWLQAANAAIVAIREAGARQLLLVPGSYWTGAHSWTTSDNARVMKGVVDPAGNFAYDVHQYLDADSSGTSPNSVPGSGSERLKAFTQWARQNKVHGFLGEFGFAPNETGLREGAALVKYMSENRDVWIGWTYWAAGPWWGDYMFSIEPRDGKDRPQLGILTSAK